jgi:endonuclease YncB( thermonuclease family)
VLLFQSLIALSGSPVLAKYLVGFVLLGGLALCGLLLRFLLGRFWRWWYASEGGSRQRSAGKSKGKKRASLDAYNKTELPDGLKVVVERVIDGDTFDAIYKKKRLRVRVLGLDTPEKRRGKKASSDAERAGSSVTQQIELGKSASERAERLLLDKKVILSSGRDDRGPRKDLYGRYLAYVEVSGKDYGLLMIKEGLGECFGWKYPHPRKASYEKAQKKAPDLLAG